jgi:DNA-binding transcriptional LysR family regulator
MKTLSEEAMLAVTGASGQHAGELSVGASHTISQYLLPKFVAGFLHTNPKVRVTARSGNSSTILDALVAREIQFALVERPDQCKAIPIEPFMEDHIVLVVPARHKWANQEIEPGELKNQPLLMGECGSGPRRLTEEALVSIGLGSKELNVVMELDSTEGLLSAVEARLGVAFVSFWGVRNQLTLGNLVLARVRGLKLSPRFFMAYESSSEKTGNIGAFRNFVLTYSRELMPRTARQSNAS